MPGLKKQTRYSNELGEQQTRWRRVDDPVKTQEPSFPFGSLASFDYHHQQELVDKSPGPVYFPKSEEILEKTPTYTIQSTASRDYDNKIRMETQSPGPIYNPNFSSTSKNAFTNGYMGSLASRDYDHKKATTSKSPGPVYNVKNGTTSNRPPPKACTIRTRYISQDDKEKKQMPGPDAYSPDDNAVAKRPKGGHIGSLASRNYHHKKVQCSRSPGPIFLPKKGVTSTRPSGRSSSFGSKFRYADDIEKSKYIAGPGSYTPEIIPRFVRKKQKKK